MELKEGMYVRSSYYGIGKIEEICQCEKCKERGFYEPYIKYANGNSDYVTSYNNMQNYEGRTSFNIIDLIEVGDYVNGYKVETILNFDGVEKLGFKNGLWFNGNNRHPLWLANMKNEDIKEVLTKEQYAQNIYRIGD